MLKFPEISPTYDTTMSELRCKNLETPKFGILHCRYSDHSSKCTSQIEAIDNRHDDGSSILGNIVLELKNTSSGRQDSFK